MLNVKNHRDARQVMTIAPPPNPATLFIAPAGQEMLKIAADGFYVRGMKVEQGEGEAKAVHEAFVAWLAAMGFPVNRG